jgi:hypothetical protein
MSKRSNVEIREQLELLRGRLVGDIANAYSSLNPIKIARALSNLSRAAAVHSANATIKF